MGRPLPRSWSCDSFAVQARHSAMGGTLFAKNSDRPALECQPLRLVEARRGASPLRLAYVEIEDVPETVPHLGSSPYWCWGHEIGLNAHGVAIGNEAIFTRALALNASRYRNGEPVEPGILGMELLRLALERSDSAHAAVDVMTRLVEQHGQWGAGTRGDLPSAAYDNSYLVADSREIWVLETAGRCWATKKIEQSTWSLSNEPTLRDDWSSCAPELADVVKEQGWRVAGSRLDFASAVTDPAVPLQLSHIRLQRSRDLLRQFLQKGRVGFEQARAVLSDHYESTFLEGPKFNPARPDFLTLCMHDSPADFTWGNTAASAVMVLPDGGTPVMWWAAGTPCTSVYLPVVLDTSALPPALTHAGTARGSGPSPAGVEEDRFADDSYWWRFQRLLEVVSGDQLGGSYRERQPVVRNALDRLQQEFVEQANGLAGAHAGRAEWSALTDDCARRAMSTADRLITSLL
jgi:secernin